jgi:hypothetical protein
MAADLRNERRQDRFFDLRGHVAERKAGTLWVIAQKAKTAVI